MAGRLAGKVAFITGAARGQGRAHAVTMAREGADIIALDLAGPLPGVPYDSATLADLDQTVGLVESQGRRIIARQGDVRDLEGMTAIVEEGVRTFGRLDVVVANAGICVPSAWDAVTPTMFQDHMEINVTGVWNTVMASAPHLVSAGGGSIILISSYAGKKVQPFMIHYTTSKHAITGMTRAFAAELGRHRIRVNSVHPGAVNTLMGSGNMWEALETAAATNPPLGQMGTRFMHDDSASPEQIADAVLFLASDESVYITSEHLSVDGGAQYF